MRNLRLITIIISLVISLSAFTQSLSVDETIEYINTTLNENLDKSVDEYAKYDFKITESGLLTATRYWQNNKSKMYSVYLKKIDSVHVDSTGYYHLFASEKCIKLTWYNDFKVEETTFISGWFDNTKDENIENKLNNAFNYLIALGKKNPNYLTSDPFDK